MSVRNNVQTRSHWTAPFPGATVGQKQRLWTVTAGGSHLSDVRI